MVTWRWGPGDGLMGSERIIGTGYINDKEWRTPTSCFGWTDGSPCFHFSSSRKEYKAHLICSRSDLGPGPFGLLRHSVFSLATWCISHFALSRRLSPSSRPLFNHGFGMMVESSDCGPKKSSFHRRLIMCDDGRLNPASSARLAREGGV